MGGCLFRLLALVRKDYIASYSYPTPKLFIKKALVINKACDMIKETKREDKNKENQEEIYFVGSPDSLY